MRGGRKFCPDPPEKSEVAVGFVRNTGTTDTDSPREPVGPLGSNWVSRKVHAALYDIRRCLKKVKTSGHP